MYAINGNTGDTLNQGTKDAPIYVPCTSEIEPYFGCTLLPGTAGYEYPYDSSIVIVDIEEDYLLDVAAKEFNPEEGFSLLALTTQTIAARTYAYRKIESGAFFDNSISNQIFVQYHFDRLGYPPDYPYIAFDPTVDPCVDPILDTGERVNLTYAQRMMCQARAKQWFLATTNPTVSS